MAPSIVCVLNADARGICAGRFRRGRLENAAFATGVRDRGDAGAYAVGGRTLPYTYYS